MVTISAPTHLSRSINGAFFINEDALRRIEAYAAAIYTTEFSMKYSLTLRDGSDYSVDSIDKVHELPLHDKARRESFKIKAQSKTDAWESFQLSFAYRKPAHAYVMIFSKTDIRSRFSHLVGDVSGQKAWYSSPYDIYHNIISAPFFFLLVWLSAYLKISVGPSWAPFFLGVVAAVALTLLVQFLADLLFDRTVIYFGEEASRQDRKRSARRWVFGTLGTGIALAIVAAALRFLVPSA